MTLVNNNNNLNKIFSFFFFYLRSNLIGKSLLLTRVEHEIHWGDQEHSCISSPFTRSTYFQWKTTVDISPLDICYCLCQVGTRERGEKKRWKIRRKTAHRNDYFVCFFLFSLSLSRRSSLMLKQSERTLFI